MSTPTTALVITSIAGPNAVLKTYAEQCHSLAIPFFVMGDAKSPKDFALDHCQFFSIAQQDALDSRLVKVLPYKTYARKNVGYLCAIRAGVERIIETDDDNYPLENFFADATLTPTASYVQSAGWVNVYKYFSNKSIWPRGLPLRYVQTAVPDRATLPEKKVVAPIQQGLADDNPDVDAIYRLVNPLPFQFLHQPPITLGSGTWCPFNSQNTVFYKEAFPLLYLPTTCGFRQTDIWRSFIAQRIAWENDWAIIFKSASVRQDRNKHDLMRDFADEIEGYLNNERIVQALADLPLERGTAALPENLRRCYQCLFDMKLVRQEELAILEAWLQDINEVLHLA